MGGEKKKKKSEHLESAAKAVLKKNIKTFISCPLGKKNRQVLFWFLGGRKQLGVGAGRRWEERRSQAQAVQTTCGGGNTLFGSLLMEKKKKKERNKDRLRRRGAVSSPGTDSCNNKRS